MIMYMYIYLTYVGYVLYGRYMPDVKVYIREENMDKWKAISKKSEWINSLLAGADKKDVGGPELRAVPLSTLEPDEFDGEPEQESYEEYP